MISAVKRSRTESIIEFVRKNTVCVIAFAAALITGFIVPPDAQYLGYFDLKTLSCLFCVLSVVCALKNIRFFYILAERIVRLCRNARISVLALVYITFIGSMLIANDMALLTFLPLGYLVLTSTGKEKPPTSAACLRRSEIRRICSSIRSSAYRTENSSA